MEEDIKLSKESVIPYKEELWIELKAKYPNSTFLKPTRKYRWNTLGFIPAWILADHPCKILGRGLNEWMIELDLTAITIAKKIGVTKQAVNRWKNQESELRGESLEKVRNMLVNDYLNLRVCSCTKDEIKKLVKEKHPNCSDTEIEILIAEYAKP